MSRRRFLKLLGQVIAGSCLAVAGGYQYSIRIEPARLVVEHVQVPIKNLRSALEGFKIVQLSDLHLYPFTQLELVQQAVDQANNLQPDLMVLTGDYVLESAESIFELAPVLATLNAKYGVFAIMGNHDYWTDAAVVRRGLEAEGLPVLRNQGLSLGVGRDTVFLAGLDDVWSGTPELSTALDKLPADVPTILLVHEPDWADTAALDGRVSLQLSGHSHGGQVRLPGLGAPILPHLSRKYDQGLNRTNSLWVYTNRGIGVSGLPIRFNCPPEVTEIRLTGV